MEENRIFDILNRFKTKFPNKNNVFSAKENAKWVNYSTQDYIQFANSFSYALLGMGFEKGDKISTVSNNRTEWDFADMGMGRIGLAHVPVYTTISETEYEHILKHSEAKISKEI